MGDSLVRVLTRIQAHWQVGVLVFLVVGVTGDAGGGKSFMVILMMKTNDVSRGESRNMMRLPEKVSCFLEELRVYLDATLLTICTVT